MNRGRDGRWNKEGWDGRKEELSEDELFLSVTS